MYPLVLGWLLAHRRSFHAVLDCQNGIPFFTPLVLPPSTPVLCVMHHVHDVQWDLHFPAWAARAGRLLEGPVARRVYRRHGCVAVSPSTVAAMRARLRWTGDIHVIPNGVGVAPGARPPGTPRSPLRAERRLGGNTPAARPASPPPDTVTWVGRLVAHKRPGLILPVAERLRGRGITIDVVGRGPAARRWPPASAAAGPGRGGPAPRLPARGGEEGGASPASLLHLNTSQGEGWGLCVLEAAALGVPTVAFDVDGLRDSVRDGETGWLVRDGERIEDVTERAVKELADPARRAARRRGVPGLGRPVQLGRQRGADGRAGLGGDPGRDPRLSRAGPAAGRDCGAPGGLDDMAGRCGGRWAGLARPSWRGCPASGRGRRPP